jgi:pimeloyl-ACP methyl ester carboxylesterase/acyl carrier protein
MEVSEMSLAHELNDSTTSSESDEVFAFPATDGQQKFWLLDLLHPGKPSHNLSIRFRLTGPLDRGQWSRALSELVRRHEALRTTFASGEDEQLLQIVSPPKSVDVPYVDLRKQTDAQSAADRLMQEDASWEFQLDTGPLLRARLLQLADDEHMFSMTIHQIVSDGWSTGIMLRELSALYDAYMAGRPSPLPEPTLQFADYAVWQKEWLETDAAKAQLAYWKGKLRNLKPLRIPHDSIPQTEMESTGRIETLLLPRELTDHLTKLGQKSGATLFMTCLTGLKILLRHRTGVEDIAIITPMAGRSKSELESIVGRFANTVVFRTDLSGNPTFRELLDRVNTTVTDAMSNQEIPFGLVADVLTIDAQTNRQYQFRMNFIFQRAFLQPANAGSIHITPVRSLSPGAMMDLNFIMVERDEGWRLSCEYSCLEYHPETIQRLIENLQFILEQIAADGSRRLADYFPLPGERESSVDVETPTPLPVAHPSPDEVRNRLSQKQADSTPVQIGLTLEVIETKLIALWNENLQRSDLTLDSDFFASGGHSLKAAKLLLKVQKQFGVKVAPAGFFESATIRHMKSLIAAAKGLGSPESYAIANGRPDPATGRKSNGLWHSSVPLFFPQMSESLFGVYHPPAGREREEGIVLCPPVGHEYMRTHWCLRLLAGELSRLGYHVFRFDYSGTGDSQGAFETARVDEWVRDIGKAIQELKTRSGIETISLVGLRLGAAFAALAANEHATNRLILWDPVTDGKVYLNGLRDMQRQVRPVAPADDGFRGEELLGYSYSRDLIGDLERMNGIEFQRAQIKAIGGYSSQEAGELAQAEPNDRIARLAFRKGTESAAWDDPANYDNTTMLHEARRAIVDLLGVSKA